jgi:Leucine-rich repeat (LRR) protein
MKKYKKYIVAFASALCFYLSSQAQLLDSAALSQAPVFENITDAMVNPTVVYRLDLTKQKLTEIPKEVWLLPNLQELILAKNKIKSVPDSIGKLTKLQILNLSKNDLTEVPGSIGQLINLRVLVINQNNLEALPGQIGNLVNLVYLDLWSNNIGFWPEQLSSLKKLRTMDVRVIQIPIEKQMHIQELLPHTKVYFSPDCKCGGQ